MIGGMGIWLFWNFHFIDDWWASPIQVNMA